MSKNIRGAPAFDIYLIMTTLLHQPQGAIHCHHFRRGGTEEILYLRGIEGIRTVQAGKEVVDVTFGVSAQAGEHAGRITGAVDGDRLGAGLGEETGEGNRQMSAQAVAGNGEGDRAGQRSGPQRPLIAENTG